MNVACARIDSGAGGLLKPNPYVEVIVDGKPPKKTETVKSTYQPKWETDMTVVVTPFSKILYRLFDHSSFKKDAVLGEHTMDLYTVLKKHQGKLQSTTVSADLYQTVVQKGSTSSAGTTAIKIGELVLVLSGVIVDLNAIPSAVPGAIAPMTGGATASPPPRSNGSVRPRPPRPASVPSAVAAAGAGSTPSRSAPPPIHAPADLVNGHVEGAAKNKGTARLPPLPSALTMSTTDSHAAATGDRNSGGKESTSCCVAPNIVEYAEFNCLLDQDCGGGVSVRSTTAASFNAFRLPQLSPASPPIRDIDAPPSANADSHSGAVNSGVVGSNRCSGSWCRQSVPSLPRIGGQSLVEAERFV